ncbi:MAG TPA: hypothetical protein VK009_07265 [Chloroflexota bacterium]|nr:hypothetical protein [Chloroflexota bacterium]
MVLLALPLAVRASAQYLPQRCQYIREFKRIHDLIPDTVGACTSRRMFAPNGDILQYTANGLIVHRKSDNWTAFTDGRTTFIDGPQGLASRPNGERFGWEHDAAGATPELLAPAQRVGPPEAYPNAALTPGATNPRVTQRNIRQTICSSSYSGAGDLTPAYAERIMKHQLARYNYADADPAHYELDHYIPVELGGDPDAPSNLWPQPYDASPGAREKDEVEAWLHDQVCSGAMTLAAAQQAILNDWVAVRQQMTAAA